LIIFGVQTLGTPLKWREVAYVGNAHNTILMRISSLHGITTKKG